MKLWLVFPLFALAHATCYDYEYYDPATGASQGNACAAQQAKAAAAAGGASVGQPTTFGQPLASSYPAALPSTTFGTTFAAPYTPVASTSVGVLSSAPVSSFATSVPVSTSYAAPAAYPTYSTSAVLPPVVTTSVAAPYTVATTSVTAPYTVASTVAAPYTVAAPAAVSSRPAGATSSQAAEIQRLAAIAQQQNQQHQVNQRIVKRASKDQSKATLINRIVAGPGNALPWYPAYRLNNQKKVVNAYRSEKQMANRNADDAYNRYLQDPSSLNMLISKYQDLNADLKGAAYQYNIVDAGTFGQNLAATGLFGISGGGMWNGINQIVTQRKQSDDLQDIQRKMKHVARQITTQVQVVAQQAKAGAVAQPIVQPGSVQQRMMALSTYGPQVSG